jgi:hypothetical protein
MVQATVQVDALCTSGRTVPQKTANLSPSAAAFSFD